MSHWYDSTPKKSRRKRDSNPESSALEADALPIGQRGGEGWRGRGGGGEREGETDRETDTHTYPQDLRETGPRKDNTIRDSSLSDPQNPNDCLSVH